MQHPERRSQEVVVSTAASEALGTPEVMLANFNKIREMASSACKDNLQCKIEDGKISFLIKDIDWSFQVETYDGRSTRMMSRIVEDMEPTLWKSEGMC